MGTVWCRGHRGEAYDFASFMEYARGFHGYPAPGLILGGAMVEAARQRLPEGCMFDAVSETRACLPDAIQLLTVCTIGNGWMRIIDSGRFALTLYDKTSGAGARVALDPAAVEKFSLIKTWLFKTVPKSEQDVEALFSEMREAVPGLFKISSIKVGAELLTKRRLGPIKHCPGCGEPYPARDGGSCKHCQGEKYYE